MMLATALLQQYPGLVLGMDSSAECVVESNVNGERITHWSRPEPQPVEADILAAFDADLYANRALWSAQAAARKDREAKAALALPDSDDPAILRRKLNAALYLIQR
jgi:hypothetical protein